MNMISSKFRGARRGRPTKLSKTLERAFKKEKCRDCTVVVTRMDFAKILGKFTKVKIQYESSTASKAKQTPITSPNSNARLKSNENGMVLIHRNAYNQHPVKEMVSSKKLNTNSNESSTRSPLNSHSSRPDVNVLKENNRLKRTAYNKNIRNSNYRRHTKPVFKQYGIIFVDPSSNNNNDKNKITLLDLLPFINKSMLPSEEWCIDYFPKNDEPKDDKVYDRIAAELEDLMYNEKKDSRTDLKNDTIESNVDDFPSIMDILNDNNTDNTFKISENDTLGLKPNLESSDVEAMLLGKTNVVSKVDVPVVAEVAPSDPCIDSTEVKNIEDVVDSADQLNTVQDSSVGEDTNKPPVESKKDVEVVDENPNSPSILDEALQKGIEEHLPTLESQKPITNGEVEDKKSESTDIAVTPMEVDGSEEASLENPEVTEEAKSENAEVTVAKLENLEVTEAKFENAEVTEEAIHENSEVTKETKSENIEVAEAKSENVEVAEAKSENVEKTIENSDSKMEVENNKSGKITDPPADVTHVVFSSIKNGKCLKSVTCPKNLKYTIELDGKLVEFIGAPRFISSLEDLQVLLQIVNDSELDSLYVLHV